MTGMTVVISACNVARTGITGITVIISACKASAWTRHRVFVATAAAADDGDSAWHKVVIGTAAFVCRVVENGARGVGVVCERPRHDIVIDVPCSGAIGTTKPSWTKVALRSPVFWEVVAEPPSPDMPVSWMGLVYVTMLMTGMADARRSSRCRTTMVPTAARQRTSPITTM